MEISINNFNYENLAENKKYKKALKQYSEILEDSVLMKKIDEQFIGFWGHVFLFFILTIIGAAVISGGWFAKVLLLISPFWFLFAVTTKWRKKRALLKEKKKNENIQVVIDYADVFKIFLEKEEVEKLGKAFFVKYNEITGTKKREYFGDVMISLEKYKKGIYLLNEEKLYEKEFSISDVVSFKRVSAEGLGDVKGSSDYNQDIDNLASLGNRAKQVSAEARLTRVTDRSGGLNTLHGDIRADKALLREKQARDELSDKIEEENKRLKDELEIRLLEFQDGDYLLMSHLEDSAVSHLEKLIEMQ